MQQPASPVTSFRTPDGSRFVLVLEASMTQVEWAVATSADPANEPAGLEGLAATVAYSSMLGTWQTGSSDVARERAALTTLDRAYLDLLAAPQNQELQLRMVTAEKDALSLSDPDAFLRVLATLPTNRPEVVAKDGVCLLQLTTLPTAIGAVAERLVERREGAALRDLGKLWLREVVVRQNQYDANPASTVYAELLALALPNQAASRAAERAGRNMPRREQALQVWQTTQRPENTVHVLLGNFDPAAVQATLNQVFAKTSLPTLPTTRQDPLRPIQSLRRSTVPGSRVPMVAYAWVLPEIKNPLDLELAARWFGGGPDSWLGRQLTSAGRNTTAVTCTAPWPNAIGGRSLLLVLVRDPAGIGGLAAQILAAATSSLKQTPSQAEISRILTDLQREWTTVTAEPRWRAAEIARNALLWPQVPPRMTVPAAADPRQIQQLLQGIFAGQPVVVEGKQ